MTAAASPAPAAATGEFDPFTAVRAALGVVLDIDPAGVSADTTLADLGADSLVLVSVADVVEQSAAATGAVVHFDDADLAAARTVHDLARIAR